MKYGTEIFIWCRKRKQKTTGSILDSVLNKNDNIAKIILEN
jgi:hypothetical protein